MIVKEGNKYVLYSKSAPKKKLGTHATKKEALDQERAIYASKERERKK